MTNSQSTKRIAQNTILLYARMLIIMAVNLYAVRLLLAELGDIDFGIYNVIAGIASMAGFFSIALSTTTLRFYAYEIGKKDNLALQEVFSASLSVFLVMGVIILLLSEGLGIWLLNGYLNIPTDRFIASHVLFQLSSFTFVVSVITIPFQTLIIANEKMNYFAIVSLIECFLKLASVFVISIIAYDKLIVYGICVGIISCVVFSTYFILCRKVEYKSSFNVVRKKSIYKQLLSFSSWSIFSSGAAIGINQGNTILVNIFFGPIVNASRAVAVQISNSIISMCSSFMTAVRPPMIKSYAESDFQYLNKLFAFANNFIFYLLLMICAPLFVGMSDVLSFWLMKADPSTVLFSRLIIVYTIIMCLNDPITVIVQATSKIKMYYILTESLTLLCMPLTFIVFKSGFGPESTFIIMIINISAAHLLRLIVLQRVYPSFSMYEYFRNFLVKAILCTSLLLGFLFSIKSMLSFSPLFNTIILISASVIVSIFIFYVFVMSKSEKRLIVDIIHLKR